MDFIERLVSEHGHVRTILTVFKEELEKLEKAEKVQYEILHGAISYCHDYLDQWHHAREDMLFETICRRAPAKSDSLSEISVQHADLARSTADIARTFHDVSERGAILLREELVNQGRALAASYEHHLEWEETRFFPVAKAVLTESDWQELETRTAGPVDPLTASPVEERYRMLFLVLAGR